MNHLQIACYLFAGILREKLQVQQKSKCVLRHNLSSDRVKLVLTINTDTEPRNLVRDYIRMAAENTAERLLRETPDTLLFPQTLPGVPPSDYQWVRASFPTPHDPTRISPDLGISVLATYEYINNKPFFQFRIFLLE